MAGLSTKSTAFKIGHGIMIIVTIVMFGFNLVLYSSHVGSVMQNQKPDYQETIFSKTGFFQMCIFFCKIGLLLCTITLGLFIWIVVLTKEPTWQLDPIVVKKVSSADKRYRQMFVYTTLFTLSYNLFVSLMNNLFV